MYEMVHNNLCCQIIDRSPDAIVILQDGGYRFVNRAFTTMFGYTVEEVADGFSFFNLVQARDHETVRQRYEQRLAGETGTNTYRIDLLTKDGNILPCETSATLISYQGQPVDLVIMRDVSERQQTELAFQLHQNRLEETVMQRTQELRDINAQLLQEIREREHAEAEARNMARRLHTVLETIGEGVSLSNESGEFDIFNPKMETLTGYTKTEANAADGFLWLLYPDMPGHDRTVDDILHPMCGFPCTPRNRVRS